MSDYVTLKCTSAKIGVTMALFALLALLAGSAEATGPAKVTVRRAAAVTQLNAQVAQLLKGKSALKLNGLTPELKGDLKKIDVVVARLESDAGIFYYFEHSTSKHFLTGTDANKKYLTIGGTALNSNEVGGLPPSAFVQGDGRLVSGAATLSGSANSQELLSTPGIEVDVAINGDGFPSVTISNSTGLLIPAVLDQGGTDGGITLQPGSNSLTPSLQNGIDHSTSRRSPSGASTAS